MRKAREPNQKKKTGDGLPGARGDGTRRMILAAARQIFAVHPYNAASIRMIAAQGDFYHGLIRYHFPNKATIFEAVVEDACQTLYLANKEWLREISTFGPDKALETYLDRFVEFSRKQPGVFRIIVNNLSHEDPATLPGYQHLAGLLTDTQKDFEETFPNLFGPGEAVRFLSGLNALALHFIGAGSIQARIMGFPAQDDDYLQWVKDTLYFIFFPVLQNAIRET